MGDLGGIGAGHGYSGQLGHGLGGGIWRVLLGVSCDMGAAVFFIHVAEKCCSLPGSRCGPSPTFRFPSRGVFKSNKNPKQKTKRVLSAARAAFPSLAGGGGLGPEF